MSMSPELAAIFERRRQRQQHRQQPLKDILPSDNNSSSTDVIAMSSSTRTTTTVLTSHTDSPTVLSSSSSCINSSRSSTEEECEEVVLLKESKEYKDSTTTTTTVIPSILNSREEAILPNPRIAREEESSICSSSLGSPSIQTVPISNTTPFATNTPTLDIEDAMTSLHNNNTDIFINDSSRDTNFLPSIDYENENDPFDSATIWNLDFSDTKNAFTEKTSLFIDNQDEDDDMDRAFQKNYSCSSDEDEDDVSTEVESEEDCNCATGEELDLDYLIQEQPQHANNYEKVILHSSDTIFQDHTIECQAVNPLTNNPIIIRKISGKHFLQEMELVGCPSEKRINVLESTMLFTPAMKEQIISLMVPLPSTNNKNGSIIIRRLNYICNLDVGVRRYAGGALSVNVVVIMDVSILSAVGSAVELEEMNQRIGAIWQLGPCDSSCIQSLSLLSVFLPPVSESDYDVSTLSISDGIVFLTGYTTIHKTQKQTQKTPCIFIAKPSVSNKTTAWSNLPILTTSNTTKPTAVINKITALATVTTNTYKLVAVATFDNRISIYDYDTMALLCRYTATSSSDHTPNRNEDKDTIISLTIPSSDYLTIRKNPTTPSSSTTYCCTSLVFTSSSSGVLLAAAFLNKVCIYSIPSSFIRTHSDRSLSPLACSDIVYTTTDTESSPENKSSLQCDTILPNHASITCFHHNHHLSIALFTKTTLGNSRNLYHLSFLSLHIPITSSSSNDSNGSHPVLLTIVSELIKSPSSPSKPLTRIQPSIIYYMKLSCILLLFSNEACISFQPYIYHQKQSNLDMDEKNLIGPFFSSISTYSHAGISTPPLGLSSNGTNFVDNDTSHGTIYYIYTLVNDNTNNSPTKRYLLVSTQPGDNNNKTQTDDRMNGECTTTYGGAKSKILCDISSLFMQKKLQQDFIPLRIVSSSSSLMAILFSSGFSTSHILHSNYPIAFTIFDTTNNNCISTSTPTIYPGRDIIFLPQHSKTKAIIAIVLDIKGTSIYKLKYKNENNNWISSRSALTSIPCCFDDDDDTNQKRSTQRIFMLSTTTTTSRNTKKNKLINHYSLVMFAIDYNKENRCCILLGPSQEKSHSSFVNVNNLLPTASSTSNCLYLNSNERNITSFIQLPLPDQQNNNITSRNNDPAFAIATESRILILSCYNLSILLEFDISTSTISLLAPIGSRSIVFCTSTKLCYLSCLPYPYNSSNVLSTITLSHDMNTQKTSPILFAIRPDRCIIQSYMNYPTIHKKTKTSDNLIALPIPTTRPLLLLEPLIANLLSEYYFCTKDDDSTKKKYYSIENSQDFYKKFKHIIHRFGRKPSSFPHTDTEGIGIQGLGITTKILQMLRFFNCEDAIISNLLFQDNNNPMYNYPSWIPMSIKASICHGNNTDDTNIIQQILTNKVEEVGQQPEPQTLFRGYDASIQLAHELTLQLLQQPQTKSNHTIGIIMKLFDLCGTKVSDALLLEFVLCWNILYPCDPFTNDSSTSPNFDLKKFLQNYCSRQEKHYDDTIITSNRNNITEVQEDESLAFASLALDLLQQKQNQQIKMNNNSTNASTSSFTVSNQWEQNRFTTRNHLICENLFSSEHHPFSLPHDNTTITTNEGVMQHIWETGAFNNMEEILLLDTIDEWLGRCQPLIIGKEGVNAAAESGERTLADILAAAAKEKDSNDGDDDSATNYTNSHGGENSTLPKGWVHMTNIGTKDEDYLSAYFRFSEGAIDDTNWRNDGFSDLSKYQNKGTLLNSTTAAVSVEATTSSVDEGEIGKIKLLYDLVFHRNDNINNDTSDTSSSSSVSHLTSGLAIQIARGSSLDIGMFHSSNHESRQQCSIEFWYHLPCQDDIHEEILLIRRSVLDIPSSTTTALQESLLWELVVLPSGELQFRSNAGTILSSKDVAKTDPNIKNDNFILESETPDLSTSEEQNTIGSALWERSDGTGGWNHVCITLSCRNKSLYESDVKIMMRGCIVASSTIKLQVPTSMDTTTPNDYDDLTNLNTSLLLSVNPPHNFRLTELRVWSCLRDESDVKSFMYEYLTPAEMKKKFKVRIRNRTTTATTTTTAKNNTSYNNWIAAPPKNTKPLLLHKRNPNNVVVPEDEKIMKDFSNDDNQDFDLFNNNNPMDSIMEPHQLFSTATEIENDDNNKKDEGSSTRSNNIISTTEIFDNNPFTMSSSDPQFSGSLENVDESHQQLTDKDFQSNDSFIKTTIDNNNQQQKDTIIDNNAETMNNNEHITTNTNFPLVNNDLINSDNDNDYLVTTVTNDNNNDNNNNNKSPPSSTITEYIEDNNYEKQDDRLPLNNNDSNNSDDNNDYFVTTSTSDNNNNNDKSPPSSTTTEYIENSDYEKQDDRPVLCFELSKPLSNVIRSSVAAALIRGPPAARHFGGSRGGIMDDRLQRNIGSIAICGTRKTVVYSYGKNPPVKTYPIIASGAIVTDIVDEFDTQYICCFMAKEKRLAVFDLRTKVIIVELQMTTKLNFWRFIPCLDKIIFLLITPIGAFHWMPLEHSPRPHQIWKRGKELQGKKIIAYEEGESNVAISNSSSYSKSRISLIIASSVSAGSTIEAWYVALQDSSQFYLINPNILGAALFRPTMGEVSSFPFICVVQAVDREHVLQILNVYDVSSGNISGTTHILAEIKFYDYLLKDINTVFEPVMAIGSTPFVLLLCLDDIIVIANRSCGNILAFKYTNLNDNHELILLGQENVHRYIVDASICYKKEVERGDGKEINRIEVILLLCNPSNSKDGNIGKVYFNR